MVLITQHLQLVEGLSPLAAGLWMLPAVAAGVAGFQLSPLLARRIRPAYLIAGGLAVSVTGLLALTQVDAASGRTTLIVGYCLINIGAGPLVTLGTNLVIGSAPPEKAGSAAAISQTSNEFGFAAGIAVMGTIGTAIYRSQLAGTIPAGVPANASQIARDTLASASAAAASLPHHLGTALLTSAREAFTTGLHTVATISAVLLTLVALLMVTVLRTVSPIHAQQPSEKDTEDTELNPRPPLPDGEDRLPVPSHRHARRG